MFQKEKIHSLKEGEANSALVPIHGGHALMQHICGHYKAESVKISDVSEKDLGNGRMHCRAVVEFVRAEVDPSVKAADPSV